jgi:hypothetical protein
MVDSGLYPSYAYTNVRPYLYYSTVRTWHPWSRSAEAKGLMLGMVRPLHGCTHLDVPLKVAPVATCLFVVHSLTVGNLSVGDGLRQKLVMISSTLIITITDWNQSTKGHRPLLTDVTWSGPGYIEYWKIVD